jgi:hypothetical protein
MSDANPLLQTLSFGTRCLRCWPKGRWRLGITSFGLRLHGAHSTRHAAQVNFLPLLCWPLYAALGVGLILGVLLGMRLAYLAIRDLVDRRPDP